MVMKIQYEDLGEDMPATLNIYYGESSGTPIYIAFHDDGVAPDVDSGDKIYAAYITEDINAFTDKISTMQTAFADSGSFLHFDGHAGKLVNTDLPEFDMD